MERFLRKRSGQQLDSYNTTGARQTLDACDSLDQSSSTSSQSPVTTHSSVSSATMDLLQTPISLSNSQTVSAGQLQPAPANTPSRRKPGKVKKLWRKFRGETTVATELCDGKQPTCDTGGSGSIIQPQTLVFTPTDLQSTSISTPAPTAQIDHALSLALEPVASPSTILTSSDDSASALVPLAPRIGVVTNIVHDNTASVIGILRDLGEIAEHIPCIKAVAGATLVLLKIRDEMEDVDEKTTELFEDLWIRSVQLAESFREVTSHNDGGVSLGGRLEFELRRYQVLLENIASGLLAMKSQGSVRKAFDRVSSRKKIEGYRRRLHSFDSTFSAGALVSLLKQVEKVVERTENLEQTFELFNDRAYGGAGHGLASTMTFVVNELMHKSLIATDRLVMQRFVGGDESQMLLKRGGKWAGLFFFLITAEPRGVGF